MNEAPLISERDLQEELVAVFAERRRSNKAAFFGRLETVPPSVKAPVEGRETFFQVAEARCELELRKALSAAGDAAMVVVVDYGLELPLDVRARLARGAILQVTPERRLANRFTPAKGSPCKVTPEVLQNRPLVDALLADGGELGPVRGPRLDLGTAWLALLARWAAFPAEGVLTEEQVVAFAASRSGWKEFVGRAARRPGLREALHEYIEKSAGPTARLAWQSWERGAGADVASVAFLLDAAAGKVAQNGYLRARLKTLLSAIEPEAEALVQEPQILERWGALASRLALRLEPPAMAAVLARAEQLLPDSELAEALAASRYLPRAFEAAKAQLAQALTRAADQPDRGAFESARAALENLRAHRLAGDEGRQVLIERALMAVRLLGYRLIRPNLGSSGQLGPAYEEMQLLAEDYAAQGAFVDYARRAARGGSADELGVAIGKVVVAVDAQRDDDDRRFAQGLVSWVAAGRKSDRVVPIDEALSRFGAALLTEDHRRLLVLVLDGMAWANAVELLLDLEGHQYGLIRWRPAKARGRSLLPPVIAALPTITEVSRAALFGGKPLKPGESTGTAKDPERFAEHRDLLKRCSGVPRLLLRGEATTANGDASKQALGLVASGERIVGIVVNAIDDHLKAGRELRVQCRLQTIKPLQDLLEAASQAGRAVLLISDHGHVPGARLESRSAPQAQGSRWRALAEGEAARDSEIVVGGAQEWRPRGKERVALLFAETESYGSGSHEGEHGGASIAEVVAPALLIASDRLAASCRPDGAIDPELEVTALPRPAWWDLELPKVVAAGASATPVAQPPTGQVPMPFAVRPAKPAAPVVEPSPAVTALKESAVFKELMKGRRNVSSEELLAQVGILVDHGGRMAPEVFAARAGMLPFRVPGAVARLAEILNIDGYAVVVHDAAEKQIRLDLELLLQLFRGN